MKEIKKLIDLVNTEVFVKEITDLKLNELSILTGSRFMVQGRIIRITIVEELI